MLPGTVRRLPDGVKHPQMQWNVLTPVVGAAARPGAPGGLLEGVPDPAWVYFVALVRAGDDRRHHRPPATTAGR